MRIAVTTSVDSSDWDRQVNGWRCPILRIPGATVESMFHKAERIDRSRYEVDGEIVRWIHGSPPPDDAKFSIRLTKGLSESTLAFRWKKLAIILPLVTTIISSLITSAVTLKVSETGESAIDLSACDPEFTLWTVRGAIKPSPQEFSPGEVQWSIRPPDLRLNPDYTFKSKLPIRRSDDGRLELPTLVFGLYEKGGFEQKVVHLLNPGERTPPGVGEDFSQEINEKDQVISIGKPIEITRSTKVYQPDQAQEAVRVAAGQGGVVQ